MAFDFENGKSGTIMSSGGVSVADFPASVPAIRRRAENESVGIGFIDYGNEGESTSRSVGFRPATLRIKIARPVETVLQQFQGYLNKIDEDSGELKLWDNDVEFDRVFERSFLDAKGIKKPGQAVELKIVLDDGDPKMILRALDVEKVPFKLTTLNPDDFKDLDG